MLHQQICPSIRTPHFGWCGDKHYTPDFALSPNYFIFQATIDTAGMKRLNVAASAFLTPRRDDWLGEIEGGYDGSSLIFSQ
jgi:hypothetical protein